MAENLKELKIRRKYNSPSYEIYFEGGARLPNELKGEFTAKHRAETALNNYLYNRRPLVNASSTSK